MPTNTNTMNSSLEYILRLKDLLSPAMRAAAGVTETAGTRIQREFQRATGVARRMGSSVDELRRQLDAINKVRFSTTLTREFNESTKAARKLENQIEKLENKGSGGGGGGMLANFVGGNLIATGISQVAGLLVDGVKDTYSKGLQMGSMRSALNATTGGHGKETIAQTSAISNKYGLNYEASLEGVKTLTGGLKSMNLPLAEQMKIFEGVSTGMAAMKLGAEESKGAMLALGQMASKGTVSAEELRGQLGERIPGAFGIAAKGMNVTEAELGKMMQKGEIAAKDFLPKFAAEMQKTFGADALAAANGPAAVQARFENAIFNMKAAMGEGLMPLVTPVLQALTRMAEMVLPPIQQGIDWLITGFSQINFSTGMWGEYLTIIQGYTNAVWTTIKSLWGNIWSIVSAVGLWIGKSELLKDIFWLIGKLGEGLLWSIQKIGDAISWIWTNMIQPILNGIDAAYSAIKGLFTSDNAATVTVQHQAKVIPMVPGMPAMGAAPGVNPINANAGASAALSDRGEKGITAKTDAVNQGGQRNITINIGKQIESLNIHVADGNATADELENAVREGMKRVLYGLNNVAA